MGKMGGRLRFGCRFREFNLPLCSNCGSEVFRRITEHHLRGAGHRMGTCPLETADHSIAGLGYRGEDSLFPSETTQLFGVVSRQSGEWARLVQIAPFRSPRKRGQLCCGTTQARPASRSSHRSIGSSMPPKRISVGGVSPRAMMSNKTSRSAHVSTLISTIALGSRSLRDRLHAPAGGQCAADCVPRNGAGLP